MKIGIIGGGVVGNATARCFIEHAEVRVYDLVNKRCTHSLTATVACDLVFICLATPRWVDSLKCNTTALDMFFQDMAWGTFLGKATDEFRHVNFVLRSTVPVGYTRKAKEKYGLTSIVHSPEFLTARCAVTDAQLPARNIIGHTTKEKLGQAQLEQHPLSRLYMDRFPGIPIFSMSSDESELVKLATNGFFATKIAYFNEVRAFCDREDLNWRAVLNAVLADGRISHSHTQVPGPDGKFGFGGECLPKDLANLISCLRLPDGYNDENDPAEVCAAAHYRNLRDREREVTQ